MNKRILVKSSLREVRFNPGGLGGGGEIEPLSDYSLLGILACYCNHLPLQ